MRISIKAAQGYRAVQRQTEPARGVEAKVFAEVTAALIQAARAGKSGFSDLVLALHNNRMLWDTLVADLALESNQLPSPIKANLIQLGHFVRQHSVRILSGEEDAEPLIDVNRAILAGLRGTPLQDESDGRA